MAQKVISTNLTYKHFIFIILFACTNKLSSTNKIYFLDSVGSIIDSSSIVMTNDQLIALKDNRPNPILHIFKTKQRKNKRVIAAVLAFPFPFGIVGLHRIYLGTAPHVPAVYIGSLGGIFGILPFIDFCVLVLDKDFDRYINNNKIFMWVN